MNAFIIFAILAVVAFIVFAFVFMYQLRTYEKPLEQETSEVYPYPYKTPFDDKLIELGVKEKWDIEYEKHLNRPKEELSRCNWARKWSSGVTFYEFINYSFDWSLTVDGYSFWAEISNL